MKMMELFINNCKEVSIQVSNDEKLTFANRMRLNLHLAICAPCRLFYEQIKILDKNIKLIKIKDFDLKEINTKIIKKYSK